MDFADRIEREIVIHAPLARVWELVSSPGWWVNDGDEDGARDVRSENGLDVVVDPKYGSFPVRTVAAEPPTYIAYEWASGFPGQVPVEGNATRVEFRLEARGDDVVLRVVESGFASLEAPFDERKRNFEGNVEGWAQQLSLARRRAERGPA
ncbi:putative Serine/threonine-protein kinase BRI1-like 1 [Streptomyces aurantiacus JA 4570]|uniref:Putative Serine/threonine-protein kinase BRI1-like 1 n=1 Tax=Streptomyces aurantiacus JA 4570 TaxID=1286094 RepID=S3ZGA1_9ACTN|nr:putative Serine/threonine-protein kinase BRI1-like 1 [Streptomyces aurantiacus JA 4570]